MMADAPGYDYKNKDKKKDTKTSGKDLTNKLKSIGWDFSKIK